MKLNILQNNKLNTILGICTMAFILTLTTSCKEVKQADGEVTENKFAGRWIPSWIPLFMLGNDQSINHYVTEIDIPLNLADSVLYLNEDVEGSYKYAARINNDTLYASLDKDTKIVLKAKDTLVVLDMRSPDNVFAYTFVKADNELIERADKLGLSATRLAINELLGKRQYMNMATKKTVTFRSNGKVEGLPPFVDYYIYTGGDSDNSADCKSIDFTTDTGEVEHLGFAMSKDYVELYDLILQTEPDEKPYYKKGKLRWKLAAIPPTGV